MKKYLLLLSMGLLLIACSKEQRETNKLEGSWKCTEMVSMKDGETLNISDESDIDLVFTFSNCKSHAKGSCEAFYVITSPGGVNYKYDYQVTEGGAKLELASASSPSYPDRTYDILELSRKKLVLERVNATGVNVKITYRKE